MEVVRDLDAWRHAAAAARQRGRTVGLVPTMGALHAGHDSLVRAARDRGDYVIVTIFVNPRQFNDPADLRAYPRTPETDRARAAALGVDLLVEPSLEQMWPAYPAPVATTVHVGGMTEHLEGADRPGHFDGVASVVAKLFALTGPARAYFGEKDFQQLAMVRQMVTDLGFAVEVVACPIVREEDGLALSSRNVRLSGAGRQRALGLSRAVAAAAAQSATASVLRQRMRGVLEAAGVEVAYAEVVDPVSLRPSRDGESGRRRALVAGCVDGVRLIDNADVELKGE